MTQNSNAALPSVNLAPSAATGLLSGVATPRVGALTAERTRGTELVSFRIPLALKAIVNRIVNDPRFRYNGTYSHFYLEAVGYALLLFEPYFRGDKEYEDFCTRIRDLDRMLALQEPLESFRDVLDRAEKKAETALAARSFDYGLLLLREAVRFVTEQEEPLQSATTRLLRDSRPMQDLCRALVEDERYGLLDEVDQLQRFMGGAL